MQLLSLSYEDTKKKKKFFLNNPVYVNQETLACVVIQVDEGEGAICARSDTLHTAPIYAKSLAVAIFTLGNAGLGISKAKQKGIASRHE